MKTLTFHYGPNGTYRDKVRYEANQTVRCCDQEIVLCTEDDKKPPFYRQVARGMDDEDPRDRGGRLHGGELLAVGRAGGRRGRRAGSCWRRLR